MRDLETRHSPARRLLAEWARNNREEHRRGLRLVRTMARAAARHQARILATALGVPARFLANDNPNYTAALAHEAERHQPRKDPR